MKTVLSTLLVLLSMTFSFGQDVAVVKSSADLLSIKETGKGKITLPQNLTAEQVKNAAQYYPKFFTVDFDESTKVATISMVENNEMSRSIIVRFLAGCSIQTINIDGMDVNRDNLFERYLK